MKYAVIAAALLLPGVAWGQAPQSVASQADRLTVQGTQIMTAFNSQIQVEEDKIATLEKQVADLTAKLAAATKTEPPAEKK